METQEVYLVPIFVMSTGLGLEFLGSRFGGLWVGIPQINITNQVAKAE